MPLKFEVPVSLSYKMLVHFKSDQVLNYYAALDCSIRVTECSFRGAKWLLYKTVLILGTLVPTASPCATLIE